MLTKILNVSGLVTTAVLNTKIGEVENKKYQILIKVSGQLLFLNAKIGEVENNIPVYVKYIISPEFHKFADSIFGAKLKQANVATNIDANAVPQSA